MFADIYLYFFRTIECGTISFLLKFNNSENSGSDKILLGPTFPSTLLLFLPCLKLIEYEKMHDYKRMEAKKCHN
jgi:hypothetical protein